MKRFILSPDAARDILDIADYISRSSRPAAKKVTREIRAAIRKLATTPALGHARPDLTDRPLKFWLVYSYLIIYDAERKPIEILRVVHGARDVERILRDT